MPLVQINAHEDRPCPAAGDDLHATLSAALADVPHGTPIVVMLHGFKFSPFAAHKSPHSHILSANPDSPKAVSWPRHLGIGRDALCIAFGWKSDGSIWRAYREAARAGRALAQLSDTLRTLRPGQQIDIVAHSLGARVALSALPHMQAGALRRAILMAPAEMRSRATAALNSAAGQGAQFLNVTSRENDLFDLMLEALIAPHRPADRSIGSHAPAHPQWRDLQIDHAETLSALTGLGHRIAPPARRVCHWSAYRRPGMFGLYRAFLSGHLPLHALPQARSRRWSRLIALPRPLHFAAKAPS